MSDKREIVLKIEELEQALQLAFFCPTTEEVRPNDIENTITWGPTTLILGDPGIGKTMTIRKVAKDFGLPLITLQASLLRDDQLTAIPIPDGKGGYRYVPFLPQIAQLAEKGAGVLFVDDLSLATENVMKPLMTLFHERRINEIELGPRIRLVAAANRAEDVGSESSLFSAFSSRVTQISVDTPSQKTYIDYSKKLIKNIVQNSKPKKKKMEYEEKEGALFYSQEDYIIQNWLDVYPDVCNSIHAYMKATKMPAHDKPGENDNKSKPWVSSRSLDAVKRWITTARILNIQPSIVGCFVIGCIGEKHGIGFWEALNKKDLPEPFEVVSGKWQPDLTRADITLIVLQGVEQYISEELEETDRENRVSSTLDMITNYITLGLGEMVVPLFKVIKAMKPKNLWPDEIQTKMQSILKEFAMNTNLTDAIRGA